MRWVSAQDLIELPLEPALAKEGLLVADAPLFGQLSYYQTPIKAVVEPLHSSAPCASMPEQ